MPVAHPVCTHEEVVRLHRESRKLALKIAERKHQQKPVASLSSRARVALEMLNYYLTGLRYQPGQHVEVEGHLYRVAKNGNPATHTGQQLPDDEPWEAWLAVDALLTREAQQRENPSAYHAATMFSLN